MKRVTIYMIVVMKNIGETQESEGGR